MLRSQAELVLMSRETPLVFTVLSVHGYLLLKCLETTHPAEQFRIPFIYCGWTDGSAVTALNAVISTPYVYKCL